MPPLAVTSAGALLRELGSLLATAQTEDYTSLFESHENTRRQRRLGSPPLSQQQQSQQRQRLPMKTPTAGVGRAVQDSMAVEDGMVVGSVALLHPTLTLVNAITLPLVRDLIPGEDFINTKEEGADAGGGGAPSIDLAAGWQLPGALSVTSLPAGTVLVHGPRLTPSVASPSLQGQFLVMYLFCLHRWVPSSALRLRCAHTGIVVRVVHWGVNPFRFGQRGGPILSTQLASHVVSVEVM